MASINLRAALERILDLALDLGRLRTRLELDQVANAPDALYSTHRGLSRVALILPPDATSSVTQPSLTMTLMFLRRDRQLPLDRGHRIPRDFRVRSLIDTRYADFDIVRDSEYTGHTLCSAFGFVLIGIVLETRPRRVFTVAAYRAA
jgi:hypothetical protein